MSQNNITTLIGEELSIMLNRRRWDDDESDEYIGV